MEVLEIENGEILIFQHEVFIFIGGFGVKVTQKLFIINLQNYPKISSLIGPFNQV